MSTFSTFTTITGRIISVRPNYSAKTFTIKTGEGSKYRTTKMNKDEFESCLYNSGNDWNQFLKSNDYYRL
jgi:hypothetical protein